MVEARAVDQARVADSCRLVSVSKDALTPAIAVLAESFTEADFAIDCDGCTACCRGVAGVKVDQGEEVLFDTVKDDKGEWRVRQVDGVCIYLDDDDASCTIHENAPRRCQEFDCRAAVIFFGAVGIDELVREAKLPLAVVEQGRAKLEEWNRTMNVRAVSGGADLSFLMEKPDAPT